MEAELFNKDLTFQPTIGQSSTSLIMNKSTSSISVTERLCRDAAERIEKNFKKSEMLSQQQSVQYPFAPKTLNDSYSSISAFSKIGEEKLLGKNFQERQELYEQRRREREEQKLAKYSQEAKCTFHPEINFTSEILIEADPTRSEETTQERLNRLAQRDQRKQSIMKEYEQEQQSKYTYHPKINELSNVLSRATGLEEIEERMKKNKEKLISQAMQKEKELCTFHPKIHSTHAQPNYSNDPKIMERIREKEKEREQKMQQIKRDHEFEEIKDCTFAPTITLLEKPPESAIINGLGRHLELQERKKKLEMDRKRREEEIFDFASKYDDRINENHTNRTIPEPFKLSGLNSAKSKLPRSIESAIAKEKSECTFKPQTNESKNRTILSSLLQNASND